MNFKISRVFAGTRYRTDRAEPIMPIPPTQDGDREVNILYRAKDGKFFIAGHGGACSQWAVRSGKYRYPGEGIKLITDAEAQRIMEQFNGPVELFFPVQDA